MTYEATKKQQGLYRKLTGQWLPRKCGKAQASKLIAAALAGDGPTPVIEVSAYRITTTMDSCRADAATYRPAIRWEVSRDYHPVWFPTVFDTSEQALAAAQEKFPGAEITVRTGVREIHID